MVHVIRIGFLRVLMPIMVYCSSSWLPSNPKLPVDLSVLIKAFMSKPSSPLFWQQYKMIDHSIRTFKIGFTFKVLSSSKAFLA